MPRKPGWKITPARIESVSIDSGFWAQRQKVNREATIPTILGQLDRTGRIDAFRLNWKPGDPLPPHWFWDSDIAKWLEAAAYSLATHPDPALEARAEEIIDLIAAAQNEDGYLNVYFTVVKPGERFTDLHRAHELYCAGHLIEAAVAYYEATGKTRMLDTLRSYADYIDSVFGKGKRRGYPGHEEIELALAKLYRVTGEERYLQLAAYFINERGTPPSFFRQENPEVVERGRREEQAQAHIPVRDQSEAVGHAVRAMYLYSGMADVAAETGDASLLKACKRLWRNVTSARMFIIGGVGSEARLERFTFDYDLPNELGYAETCAAIGLVFWAHRMLQLDVDGRYADVMERALYNGTISGVSLDGRRFFYTNPHAVSPMASSIRDTHERFLPERPEWFPCACCPPNLSRLIASLGRYAFSSDSRSAYVHLYLQGRAELQVAGQTVTVIQKTAYPWKEKVRITVQPEKPAAFTLALRIPGWCRKPRLLVNGKAVRIASVTNKGYARIKREWKPGDEVELTLPMPVERVESHPGVRMNCGRVALMRGPIVYCLEEVDNGPDLQDIALPRDAKLTARFAPDLLGGVVVLTGKAKRRRKQDWPKGELYRADPTRMETAPILAVPYFAWANRKLGEMTVWIRDI